MVNILSAYGGLAEALLERIITAKRIDFVCDTLDDSHCTVTSEVVQAIKSVKENIENCI